MSYIIVLRMNTAKSGMDRMRELNFNFTPQKPIEEHSSRFCWFEGLKLGCGEDGECIGQQVGGLPVRVNESSGCLKNRRKN